MSKWNNKKITTTSKACSFFFLSLQKIIFLIFGPSTRSGRQEESPSSLLLPPLPPHSSNLENTVRESRHLHRRHHRRHRRRKPRRHRRHGRHRRSLSAQRFVEALIVVDKSMMDYYKGTAKGTVRSSTLTSWSTLTMYQIGCP